MQELLVGYCAKKEERRKRWGREGRQPNLKEKVRGRRKGGGGGGSE